MFGFVTTTTVAHSARLLVTVVAGQCTHPSVSVLTRSVGGERIIYADITNWVRQMFEASCQEGGAGGQVPHNADELPNPARQLNTKYSRGQEDFC